MPQQESLYCQIRKEWVGALPEESVRQSVLHHLITNLGFPSNLIAVEKALCHLPHLSSAEKKQIPDRRADIICFTNQLGDGTSLLPLLIIECKAVPLTKRVVNQVLGYNHFIKAYFIAVVNQAEIRMGWYDTAAGQYTFLDYLPSYSTLLSSLQPLI